MVPNFAILTNVLLASVVLAVPSSSSRLETHLARRRENHQSKPMNRIDATDGAASNIEYSTNWAGAVWSEREGTFTTVTGTFTLPTLNGSDGSASAWVGIDGDSCQNAILQTGVDFTISGGKVSYDAWYEWYPDYAYYFDKFTMRAGDKIKTTVTASSKTSGKAVIENLTTGQAVTKKLSSSYSLCGQDAEWIVEDFEDGGGLVAFANFGAIKFTNATASGSGNKTYTPDGATIIDIEQDDVLTSVSISGDTVTIKRIKTV